MLEQQQTATEKPPQTRATAKRLPALALILSACATPIPVPSTCPPPPPVPEVLTASPSTGESLSLQYERLIREFKNSLTKAQKLN